MSGDVALDSAADADSGPVTPPECLSVTCGNGGATTAATATALTDADGDGGGETSIALPPGEHRYKFIVDGVAEADPGNPFNEPDGAGGTQSVLTAGDCAQADAGGPGCRWLFAAGGSLSHHCASPKTGCAASADCPDGCVSDVWIAVDLGARRAVTDLRFRSDWWARRPKGWELWVSDSMLRGPQTGAALVTTGSGQQAPAVRDGRGVLQRGARRRVLPQRLHRQRQDLRPRPAARVRDGGRLQRQRHPVLQRRQMRHQELLRPEPVRLRLLLQGQVRHRRRLLRAILSTVLLAHERLLPSPLDGVGWCRVSAEPVH